MNNAAFPTLAAIVIQLALGLTVFQANPRRKSNQCFLLLSAVIGCLAAVLPARRAARLDVLRAIAAE